MLYNLENSPTQINYINYIKIRSRYILTNKSQIGKPNFGLGSF